MTKKILEIFILATFYLNLVKSNESNGCKYCQSKRLDFCSKTIFFQLQKGFSIEECSPAIAALDYSAINSTIEVKCRFRNKLQSPLDIMWKYEMGKDERMAFDMDGVVYRPFKHEVLTLKNSQTDHEYSISVLTIQLLNSSYFTNYSIMDLNGQCQQTVKIHLKERGKDENPF
jgi:hypothetical protein